jgi:allantoinase
MIGLMSQPNLSRPLVVRGKHVIRPDSSGSASIHIRDGVITAIDVFDAVPAGVELVEAGDSVVMPGLVDTHVHLNEPGRTDWEGFGFGTRAAAAGGVTTLMDMPLNSIPATTTVAGLHAKVEAARDQCWVDVGFWGGVVPGNADQIEPLIEGGVFGFKCFLVPSGVDEFPHVTEEDLRRALPRIAANRSLLLVHAELPGPIDAARSNGSKASARSYRSYLASRPRAAENEAIELLIRLTREFGARIHIVHLSSADAIPALRRARAEGLPITVETCPHYLLFSAEEIPDGATQFKCAPPIRENENREGLWSALAEGVVDFITTDHSPCPASMKCRESGDFFQAWGGITSLQLGLSSVWTEARRSGYSLGQVAEWLSTRPARVAGLHDRKGGITEGKDADLVLFQPDSAVEWPQVLYHRHKLTPYEGRALMGVVERTIVRGNTVYHRGEFAASPSGNLLYGPLHRLNAAGADEARSAFLRCCGSSKWATQMEMQRPYPSVRQLLDEADRTWSEATVEDWLEAFRAHPRIGETSQSKWSEEEQAGARSAETGVLRELAEGNRTYYERFGFIFIICASGKRADEMLAALRSRLKNDRATELRNAGEEQRLITRLRLLKLIEDAG